MPTTISCSPGCGSPGGQDLQNQFLGDQDDDNGQARFLMEPHAAFPDSATCFAIFEFT